MWHVVEIGTGASSNIMEFMIDSETDITNEPTEYGTIAPGSIAYTNEPGGTGMEKMFMKASNGTWNEM